jgi:hypothetical protein
MICRYCGFDMGNAMSDEDCPMKPCVRRMWLLFVFKLKSVFK